jgi:hypothetical protein
MFLLIGELPLLTVILLVMEYKKFFCCSGGTVGNIFEKAPLNILKTYSKEISSIKEFYHFLIPLFPKCWLLTKTILLFLLFLIF